MIRYQTFNALTTMPNCIHGFTYRNGGGVHELPFGNQHMGLLSFHYQNEAWDNIRDLVDTLNVQESVEAIVATEQVHQDSLHAFNGSEEVAALKDGYPLHILKATDGVFTQEKNVLLLTFYADCTPVYFQDPVTQTIGMVHSGWKGTALKIAVKGLGFMQDRFGALPEHIRVVIGPAASACCYEVDQTVMDHFPNHAHCFEMTRQGHYKMAMKQIIYEDLLEAGLSPDQIEVSPNCTLCQQDLYFSHRGEAGNTGRMAAFMMLCSQ